jgi:tripartite-type tricarboxylate transporter receptor subunit TctC
MNLRRLVKNLIPAAALVAASAATAQYPAKPIRIVVPYSPGGALDATLRLAGDQVSASLKQPVVIENRPGGSTTIGTQAVAQAPADGYTLFVNAASFAINPHLMPKLPYDTFKDFVPVTLMTANSHVLVAATVLGTPTFKEFVAVAKAKGKALSYASFGNGSSGHLAFEQLKRLYGFDMVHIPYKGAPPAMLDIMGGQLHAMLTDLPVALPYVKGGKLAGLAIAAERRSPALTEVPTFQEAGGQPFLSRSWFGLVVRAGTAPEIVRTLNEEFVKALQKPEVKDKLVAVGTDVLATSPEAFGAFMKRESERYAEAVKAADVKIE